MRSCVLLVVLAGCGRLGFEPAARVADGAVDVGEVDAAVCASLFCDGFEDPALSAWSGVAVEGGSLADRLDSFGYRGASLKAYGEAGSEIAARFADVFPTPPPSEQWVRAYVYAPTGVTLNLEPVSITDATQTVHVVFSLYEDGVDIHAHNLAGNFEQIDPTPPQRDRWVCYELRLVIGMQGAVELYRDGALVLAASGLDTRPDVELSRVMVGIASKPLALTTGIHVDEVAAGTQRPGCL